MAIELLKTNWFGDPSLQAYYRFESGALTTDSSGQGHTLTAVSDPAKDASGKFGGAVALDGNDAYSAVDHADFKPTGSFTIGAWVKSNTDASARQTIFSSWDDASSKYSGILFRLNSSTGYISLVSAKNTGQVNGTDYTTCTGTTDLTNNVWHFVVGTWDGTHLKVFVDGTQEGTDVDWVAPAYPASSPIFIGCGDTTGSAANFFTGSLDDVFLLNGTALSADQIKGIYDGTTNFKLNIGDDWKDADNVYINIGDAWKKVTQALINIGDTWKSIF
jgi:hypothetical protein